MLSLLLLSSCAAQRRFDVNSRIVIHAENLGNVYEQDNESLGRCDILDKLSRRGATQADADTAIVLTTVAAVIGAVGGALVGWPIGRALAGKPEPPWFLAGIGAGAIGVAIPLSFGASSKLESAVRTHNGTLPLNRTLSDPTPIQPPAPRPPETPW